MKIGITINLGNYESLRVESSEHDNLIDAVFELKDVLENWKYIVDRTEFWIRRMNMLLKQLEEKRKWEN